MTIDVEAYSGYKSPERPVRFRLGTVTYQVNEVVDRWYGPGDEWFKVRAHDGNLYILRYRTDADEWTLESFRAQ